MNKQSSWKYPPFSLLADLEKRKKPKELETYGAKIQEVFDEFNVKEKVVKRQIT